MIADASACCFASAMTTLVFGLSFVAAIFEAINGRKEP